MNNLWPLYLLIITFPLSIAAQTIASTLVLLVLTWFVFRNRASGYIRERLEFLIRDFKLPLLLGFLLLAWLIVTSLINEKNPESAPFHFFVGSLPWLLLPAMVFFAYGSLTEESWGRLEKLGRYVVIVWALLALSQFIFGWQLDNFTITSDVPRPRGLYPHPLTLAYAALFIWPLAVSMVFYFPSKWSSWAWFLSGGVIIVLTQSRTVQAVALLILSWRLFLTWKGRTRVVVTLSAIGFLVAVMATDNFVSEKFRKTFSSEGVDRFSSYPDDRLAFWHVHALMISEKPILGHGVDLNTKYREPYYAALGLQDFPKKYEAHNMFLQIAAEGGLVGLGLFLGWLGWHFRRGFLVESSRFARETAIQTLVAFTLGGLTQNVFQDYEVRVGLTLFLVLLWLLPVRPRECSHRHG